MDSMLLALADDALNCSDNQFDGKKREKDVFCELQKRLVKRGEEFGLRQNHRKIPFPHFGCLVARQHADGIYEHCEPNSRLATGRE